MGSTVNNYGIQEADSDFEPPKKSVRFSDKISFYSDENILPCSEIKSVPTLDFDQSITSKRGLFSSSITNDTKKSGNFESSCFNYRNLISDQKEEIQQKKDPIIGIWNGPGVANGRFVYLGNRGKPYYLTPGLNKTYEFFNWKKPEYGSNDQKRYVQNGSSAVSNDTTSQYGYNISDSESQPTIRNDQNDLNVESIATTLQNENNSSDSVSKPTRNDQILNKLALNPTSKSSIQITKINNIHESPKYCTRNLNEHDHNCTVGHSNGYCLRIREKFGPVVENLTRPKKRKAEPELMDKLNYTVDEYSGFVLKNFSLQK
ncbi:unnamed protein product [Brachionus calyciflorus]|uniref:Uncharacterized protein n=1 Tax=Brachionus calyciflorus TaxID=104777 RepID=A0A814K8C7_9BILA|nr:unnamed protein product [Brachionus calyciflorus]